MLVGALFERIAPDLARPSGHGKGRSRTGHGRAAVHDEGRRQLARAVGAIRQLALDLSVAQPLGEAGRAGAGAVQVAARPNKSAGRMDPTLGQQSHQAASRRQRLSPSEGSRSVALGADDQAAGPCRLRTPPAQRHVLTGTGWGRDPSLGVRTGLPTSRVAARHQHTFPFHVRELYRCPSLAERFFRLLKRFRRVATRQNKHDVVFLAFILLAVI